MNESEIIGHLISLLNARLERFDRSRNIQWKINGLLWSAIVVSTGFLITHEEFKVNFSYASIFSIAITLLHWATIKLMQNGLNYDRKYIIKIHKLINEEFNKGHRKELNELVIDTGFGKANAWLWLQIIPTVLLFITYLLTIM